MSFDQLGVAFAPPRTFQTIPQQPSKSKPSTYPMFSKHLNRLDMNTLTVLQKSKPSSGLKKTTIDGIKVGNMFFTYEILVQSIRTVPYLLYPLANAKLLFDRENTINPLLKEISTYFAENSEARNKWLDYYKRFKQEKAQFGYEKTTIIDVWNELEKEYSGRSKRPFFNAFYLTSPIIFSLLKRFL